MKDTKLIKLLKSLSATEIRWLYKFLLSPFYNSNEILLRFFEHLRKSHPTFDSPSLEKEKVFQKLFPGKPFDDKRLRTLRSQLKSLVEQFLVAWKLRNHEFRNRRLLIESLGDRNLYDLFEKGILSLKNELEALPYRDLEFHTQMAFLNYDYFFHPLTKKHTLRDDALIDLMESVDQQFALAKLHIGSELKNREKILSKRYEIRFFEELSKEFKKGFMKDNLAIQLYNNVLKLYLPESDHSIFYLLKKQFSENLDLLRRTDLSFILNQLTNYAAVQINRGDSEFYAEALYLYKLGLKNDLILEKQRIDEAIFGNIIILGCQAKEFQWTRDFINNYQKYLPDDVRSDAVALNMGLWYFHQGNYEKAQDHFFNHPFSHYYQPKARISLIKTLFEQYLIEDSFYSLLIAHIEAFEKFIHRSEIISSKNKKAYLNFASILKKMSNGLSRKSNVIRLKNILLKDIEKKEKITLKSWLLEKINSL